MCVGIYQQKMCDNSVRTKRTWHGIWDWNPVLSLPEHVPDRVVIELNRNGFLEQHFHLRDPSFQSRPCRDLLEVDVGFGMVPRPLFRNRGYGPQTDSGKQCTAVSYPTSLFRSSTNTSPAPSLPRSWSPTSLHASRTRITLKHRRDGRCSEAKATEDRCRL